MSEPIKKNPVAAAPSLPGMPAGKTSVAPVARESATIAPAKLDRAADSAAPAEKKLFGGNVGRKTRADGLRPGSPEALEADRARDAERKRREREEKRLATPPPALPAGAPPGVDTVAATADAADGAAGLADDPVCYQWTAESLNGCSNQIVQLLESWCVNQNVSLAAKGGLPKTVVEKIGRDSAFPSDSKRALRESSPAALAKLLNAVKAPLQLKYVIDFAPSMLVIALNQISLRREIENLVKANQTPPAEAKKA